MKTVYVSHLHGDVAVDSAVTLLGWLRNKRSYKERVFLDMVDSTGVIQAVAELSRLGPEQLEILREISVESALRVDGCLRENQSGVREIQVDRIEVVGAANKQLSPSPRGQINIFDEGRADHLLRNRHLYIRNPKAMAILQFRSELMGAVQSWFRQNNFIELCAPVLTPLPLYSDGTAMAIQVHDESVFLTQCVGYYLEAAVHAFERVFNMGPSFRGEESRSKRHLMEYWHIKAEIAFCDREDLMTLVESLLQFITLHFADTHKVYTEVLGTEFCMDALNPPFPRITYREALSILAADGRDLAFGKSLGSEEEEFLSRGFNTPFWVVGIPRAIEPFPYVIDPDDPELTMTADLICSRGKGELLGVAEKIPDLSSLDERMQEKGRYGQPEYNWLRELREVGCVPHGGFGMGVERLIRWLLQIEHVRDAMPFPRTFQRRIYP